MDFARIILLNRPICIAYLPPVRHGYALARADTQFRSVTAMRGRKTLID